VRLGEGVQRRKARADQQQALRGEALEQGREGLLRGALGKNRRSLPILVQVVQD